MNTDNGTDWDKVGNAIIIYHTNDEHPLWLSREDLEEMLRVLEEGRLNMNPPHVPRHYLEIIPCA